MSRQLIYVALPFWRDGARLRAGRAYRFTCAVDTEEGGKILARSAAGVVAYQQEVHPEFEVCEDPDILGVWGDVPMEVVCDQPEPGAAYCAA